MEYCYPKLLNQQLQLNFSKVKSRNGCRFLAHVGYAVIMHDDAVIMHDDVVIMHDDAVIMHDDAVIMHDDAVIMHDYAGFYFINNK